MEKLWQTGLPVVERNAGYFKSIENLKLTAYDLCFITEENLNSKFTKQAQLLWNEV
jgi:hypothetical protein